MATVEEQIKAIEEELAKTEYNKATEHHIGKLKAKLARLREEALKVHGARGAGAAFAVKKSGHATVGLVGLPSVGKSTILNRITNARSEVAAYEFTTLSVIPGLLVHNGARIQVLDMPGIIRGASVGRGRGREVLSVARAVDLVLAVVNAFNPAELDIIERELWDGGLRVNRRRADIVVHKTDRGGIQVKSTVSLTKVTPEYVAELLREFKIVNADVVLRHDASADDVIDHVAGNRVYVKGLAAVNKVDLVDPLTAQDALRYCRGKGWDAVAISAERNEGLDTLKARLYGTLGFIRVYLKPHRGKADMQEPLVILAGSTVGDVCDSLHRDFRRLLRYAQVWGPSAKFPGQTVGLDHGLLDRDVLTVVVKKA